MTERAKIGGIISLGNGGISKDLRELGYIGTICASVHTDDGSPKFQDLHVTEQQLRGFVAVALDFLEKDLK